MKLSKWQPAGSKPKLKGVYQTKDKSGFEGAQYWTGKYWGIYSATVFMCELRKRKTKIYMARCPMARSD